MVTETTALSSHTTATIKKNYTQLETWPKEGHFVEAIIIASSPICLWGIIGNGIILWFLCTRIKRTRFTIYISHLVVADLTVLIYYSSVFILFAESVYVDLVLSRIMEIIYLFAYYASIYFLTVISAERCLMLIIPTWYQHYWTKHLSKFVCTFLWILSGFVSVVVYASCYPRFLSSYNEGSFRCDAATVFKMIINLFIFFPVMFIATLTLFVRTQIKVKQSSTKFDITITVMVVLFLIFAFSVRIFDTIAYWDQRLDAPIPFLVSLLFDSIKSSVNPCVYFCVGNWKRKIITKPIHLFLERALNIG